MSGLALNKWGVSCVKPLVKCEHGLHTRTHSHSFRNPLVSQRKAFPTPPRKRCHVLQSAESSRSAAAEFSQEVRQAEEDPHDQEVGAQGQQRQRVQEAGVQPQVAHRQQATQVLLDHPFSSPNAAKSPGLGRRGKGEEQQTRLEEGEK